MGTEAQTIDDAEDLFITSMNRLLHINQWGMLNPAFAHIIEHTDGHGKPVNRGAHKGDYVKLNTSWHCILNITYNDYPDINKETIELHFAPALPPSEDRHAPIDMPAINDAELLLIIERVGKKLTASCHIHDNMGALAIPDELWNSLLAAFVQD